MFCRVIALKKKATSSAAAQTERPMRLNHQLRLAESIKNALNDILSNDVVEFQASDSVHDEYNQDTIVNSALQKGSVCRVVKFSFHHLFILFFFNL